MLKKIVFPLFVFLGLAIGIQANAVCPVCTVAVCAGVGLSRWLGVDDLISGVWVGGLILSVILWTLDWLNKKQIRFKFRSALVYILFYLLLLLPLYYKDIIGNPSNKFLGIDKLLFGIILGTIVFLFAVLSHNFLKKRNQGKSYFPFQKVVLPLAFLIITSLIIYLSICQK